MKKPRSADLTIRLSEADRRVIEAAARDDHLPASTWLRQAALRQAAEKRALRNRRARLVQLAARVAALPRFEREE